jgi:hypothetical protein
VQQATRGTRQLHPALIAPAAELSSAMPLIATVATDGGENRLNLEPIRLQVIRVADSQGRIFFEEFIPGSLKAEQVMELFFKTCPQLNHFLRALDLGWERLLPETDFQRSHLLSMMRELMEWAAMLDLAATPPPRLLIRDGLLRSVILSDRVFNRLADCFEELTSRHGHLLAGVAKRSSVINYLSVAVDLNETFPAGQPAYVRIPPALECEAAPRQYRWIGSRSMGWLHLARLDPAEGTPLLPVDVPSWQRERVPEIMSLLHASARGSFPVRGYPQALIRAHEHARLGGLEIEMLESVLLEQIASFGAGVARQARLLRLLGKKLIDLPDHESTQA